MINRRTLLKSAAVSMLPLPAFARSTRETTLKVVPQSGLTVLDPVWTTSASAAGHGFHVFDQLYGLDADLNPKPQMAEGSTVSDDKLTWTITLRDGLKFHDGENVLSRDCIASLKRWGVRDTLGQSLVAAVDQWKVVDDKTFSISLKSPFPMMLYALGKPATSVPFIMPERLANTDAAKQVTEMIGSGPYRFVADEFISGSMAAYRKFEGYVPRQEPPVRTSGGKVAYFDRVEWQAIPDAATVAAALKRGEVDWWEQVLSDMVPVLKSDRNIRVSNGDPNGYVGLLRFNSLQPPFNNPKLRQAVLSAVRQSDYMEAITGNDRTAYQHCHSFLPCGTPYAQTPKTDRLSDDPDLARARELVKASGYAGEKVVIINPTDFPSIQPMGQITAALCRSLGLNVELVETDWGSVLQRRGSREATDKGGWSIFHTWWQAIGITTPATNAYMRGQGSTGWFGWYQNDRIESLTKEWISAVSDADRLRISNDIQDLVAIDAPSVPLGLFQIRSAYRSDITGIVEGVAPFPWNVRRT